MSVLRSSDQLYEVVSLAAELLPVLPDASKIVQDALPVVAEPGTLTLASHYDV